MSFLRSPSLCLSPLVSKVRAHGACAEALRTDQLPKGSARTAPAQANSVFAAVVVVPLPSPSGDLCGAVSSQCSHPCTLTENWWGEGVGVSGDRASDICSIWTLRIHAETKGRQWVFVKLWFSHVVVDVMAVEGRGANSWIPWSLCLCGWIRPSGSSWGMGCPPGGVGRFRLPIKVVDKLHSEQR